MKVSESVADEINCVGVMLWGSKNYFLYFRPKTAICCIIFGIGIVNGTEEMVAGIYIMFADRVLKRRIQRVKISSFKDSSYKSMRQEP